MNGRRLAIVGAGFSAMSLLRQLVERDAPLDEVMLYGRADEFATGPAYGLNAVDALLNTRAADLGLVPERPGEFADWVGLEGLARDALLPRRLYGAYLRESLIVSRSRSRFPVRVQGATVDAIIPSNDAFEVSAEGRTERADIVVLAFGSLPPTPISGPMAALHDFEGFVDDPWRADWESRISSACRVVILGTGLSMVDHVQRLSALGVRAPVTVLSRRGLLPHAHLLRRDSPAMLSDRLMEASQAGDLLQLVTALRDACDAAEHWQSVLDAFRPHVGTAWQALPAAERQRFLRHVRPFWDVHRHRLSPAVRERIDYWTQSGWVKVIAGRVVEASVSRGEATLVVRARGSDRKDRIRCDLVLRATGRGGSGLHPGMPALDNLATRGLLLADPNGLGLAVDTEGRPLNESGKTTGKLFILGAAARGCRWEATAIPELRLAARQVVNQLAI